MDLRLRSEIFALIIKGGARAMTNLAELLTTTSLVSREFRIYSHEELFRSVKLGPSTVPAQIWRLLGLISADSNSDQNGLTPCIQSLDICLVGLQAPVRQTLDDGTLAAVLGKWFTKGSPIDQRRSLQLFVLVVDDRWNPDLFDWSTLNEDFLLAFHSVCQNPLLTILFLVGFKNVPPDLLNGTHVKDFRFQPTRLSPVALSFPRHVSNLPTSYWPCSARNRQDTFPVSAHYQPSNC